jgi:hypothetical protein
VARTVVRLRACATAVRRALLLAVVGGTYLGALLWITPDAASAASGGCPPVETQVAASPEHTAEAVELQRVLDEKQGGGGGGLASPDEEPVVAELEAEFGSQYGSVWYESEPNVRFVVGLTPGKLDINEASEKLRQILARQVASQNLAFAEARSQVRAVPYTPDELDAALASIRGELKQVGASTVSTGLGGGAGAQQWPQVAVIFEANATATECEAVELMLAKYGNEIAFSRMEDSVVSTIADEGPPAGQEPSLGGKASPSSPGVSHTTNGRANGVGTVLRAIVRSLRRRNVPADARMTVTLPATGKLAVKIWMLTGRVRRLVADGATWADTGDREVVVLVKPTAFGRHLSSRGRYRLVGEVRLLTNGGDLSLARVESGE